MNNNEYVTHYKLFLYIVYIREIPRFSRGISNICILILIGEVTILTEIIL